MSCGRGLADVSVPGRCVEDCWHDAQNRYVRMVKSVSKPRTLLQAQHGYGMLCAHEYGQAKERIARRTE
jgi:hypothetical protein